MMITELDADEAPPDEHINTMGDLYHGPQIGRGATAVVGVVSSGATGQRYALKAIGKAGVLKEGNIDHVYREKDALSSLRHPGIALMLQTLKDAPDPTSRLGIRDRAMLYLGLTGGLRVSELVGLRLDDVRFDGRFVEIRVHGKGRKERALLLWKEVGDAIRAWLARVAAQPDHVAITAEVGQAPADAP